MRTLVLASKKYSSEQESKTPCPPGVEGEIEKFKNKIKKIISESQMCCEHGKPR